MIDYGYLYDLSTRVVQHLKDKQLVLATAESCTGGMIAKSITDIDGASRVFDCAFVTYSNESKVKVLGVSNETLMKYGAVSEETSVEMARGALENAMLANCVVTTTGIAGPTGGSVEKPVGLVYIALCAPHKHILSMEYNIKGDRDTVRRIATKYALEMLLTL